MKGDFISYFDICQREGTRLQRWMNFRLGGRTPSSSSRRETRNTQFALKKMRLS